MFQHIGNTSQLFGTINDQKIKILKGEVAEKINTSYCGKFTLEIGEVVSVADLYEKKVSMSMKVNEVLTYFHGIATEVYQWPSQPSIYDVVVESPLFLMMHQFRSRAFSYTTTEAVLKTVLTDSAFLASELEFTFTDEEQQYVEQHQTSDYQFFHRILSERNLFYTFQANEDAVLLCIDEQSRQAAPASAPTYSFIPDLTSDGTMLRIHSLRECYRPEVSSLDTGRFAQRNNAVEILCNIPDLVPGKIFYINRHPNLSVNGCYRVIESLRSWDESGNEVRYQNTVFAALITQPWALGTHESTKPIGHLSLAAVKSDTPSANLTDKGEYFIKAHDIASFDEDHAPVRQSQSFVGNNYGMHFPLLAQAEVVMARVNGHPDEPVILGALYNEDNINPVSGADPYANVIKTGAGNMLHMHDAPEERSIRLQTASEENQFILDANLALPHIKISSQKGGFLLHTETAAALAIGADVTLSADESIAMSANAMAMASGETLSLKSGSHLSMSAKELVVNIEENVTNTILGDFHHTVFKNYDLQCQGEYRLLAEEGSVHLQTLGGSVVLMAESGTISLSVGDSLIQCDEGGSCVVRANQLTLQSKVINMQHVGSTSIASPALT